MIFREATSADATAILALRRRCFPEDDLEKPRPSRMFVAEEDGRPVAHLGFIPQTYVIDGNEYAGALAVDAMTDPAYRKQGLFRRVAAFARDAIREQYALSTAWQIRPAVLGAMVAAGWEPILRAPVLVKPFLFRRTVSRRDGGGVGEGIVPSRESLLEGYAHVRLEGNRFDAPYYARHDTCVTRETTLRGRPTLALIDLTAKPVLPPTNMRLAAAFITWRHPLVPALLRSGFLPSPHRFRFLVTSFDRRIDPKRARWALTWADTDHL